MSNNFSFAAARDAVHITDPVERMLTIKLLSAASNYDAAIDGAYYAAYPRDVAERKYFAAVEEYDRAVKVMATSAWRW